MDQGILEDNPSMLKAESFPRDSELWPSKGIQNLKYLRFQKSGFLHEYSMIFFAGHKLWPIISLDNHLNHLSGNSKNSLTQGQTTSQAIYRLKST